MQAGVWLHRLSRSTLVRNTMWMLFAQGGRFVTQAVYFVLIGRALGPVEYGAFAGAAALVAALVPFAGWGSGNILLQRVAVDARQFRVYWGNAVAMIGISNCLLVPLAILLGRLVIPDLPLALVLLIAVADLVFGRLLELCAQAYQAFEQMQGTALLGLMQSCLRLGVALVLFITGIPRTALDWAVWYLASTVVSALSGFILVNRRFGKPQPQVSRIPATLREGWHFSVGLAAATIYSDIDKAMMTRFAPLEIAGVYAAAYRLVTVAFMPVRSLLYASYVRFFRQGVRGIRGSLSLAGRLLPFCAAYGLFASLGLFLTAPITPLVLGKEYYGLVDVVRWLAPVPLVQSLYFLGADTLTGAGLQGRRSLIQVTLAVINVLLNLWLIPKYSWMGAAISTLLTETLLGVTLWIAVWSCFWSESKGTAAIGRKEFN